jgi:hypothetical protein
LTKEEVEGKMPSLSVTARGRLWSSINLLDATELENLGPILCAAWDQRSSAYGSGNAVEEPTEE